MKVLVVDDNDTSRNIFKEMLESFSFEVPGGLGRRSVERNGRMHPQDQRFKLVIMDWKMPGMDGIETARRIKTHRTLSDTRHYHGHGLRPGRDHAQAEKTGWMVS